MFSAAQEFLRERQALITHDSEILNKLSQETLPVKETWALLSELKSDTIWFYACEQFMATTLGNGKAHHAGDDRLTYVCHNTRVSFPGQDSQFRSIIVSFDDFEDIHLFASQPAPIEPTKEELAVKAYADALRNHTPTKTLVTLRAAIDSKTVACDGEFKAILYYYLYQRPKDFLSGFYGLDFWEQQAKDMEEVRKRTSQEQFRLWALAKETLRSFKTGLYPSLQRFDIPIYVGKDKNSVPAEPLLKSI